MKISICKKQYVYLGLAIVSAFVALTTYVSAQEPEAASAAEPAAIPANAGNPQNGQGQGQERKAETPKIPEALRNRMVNLASNLNERLTAAVARYTNIADRLDTRIVKIEANGVDTAAAKAKLAEARSSISSANIAITALFQAFQSVPTAEQPRMALGQARVQFQNARSALVAAHIQLRETIMLLKEALRATEGQNGVSDATSAADAEQNNAGETTTTTE